MCRAGGLVLFICRVGVDSNKTVQVSGFSSDGVQVCVSSPLNFCYYPVGADTAWSCTNRLAANGRIWLFVGHCGNTMCL